MPPFRLLGRSGRRSSQMSCLCGFLSHHFLAVFSVSKWWLVWFLLGNPNEPTRIMWRISALVKVRYNCPKMCRLNPNFCSSPRISALGEVWRWTNSVRDVDVEETRHRKGPETFRLSIHHKLPRIHCIPSFSLMISVQGFQHPQGQEKGLGLGYRVSFSKMHFICGSRKRFWNFNFRTVL